MHKPQPFFKRPKVIVAGLTLLFVFILFAGLVPVWIVLNMDQKISIRIIIGCVGLLWAILTVVVLIMRTDYFKKWRLIFHKQEAHNMKMERSLYPEYQELYKKYPLSIVSYERHWRHHPDGRSFDDLMIAAMQVSPEEWAQREAFRRENLHERHSHKDEHFDSLAPSRQHEHHHHHHHHHEEESESENQ